MRRINKKNKRLIISVMLATQLIFFAVMPVNATGVVAEKNEAFEFVDAMRVGWNLGNALDSVDLKKQGIVTDLTYTTPEIFYETLWGNPVTTKEMIEGIAEGGFGAVRVPVSYYDHFDENFKISESWLIRVEEIVNYVLDSGMYCIINLHHEDGWIIADAEQIEQIDVGFARLWRQIAEHFKEYDNRLAFEGFNEIVDAEEHWTWTSPENYAAINRLNQTFVDTVRSVGGNNAERFLILKTFAAGVTKSIIDAFVLPQDSAKERLVIGVHSYSPYPFSDLRIDMSTTPTKANSFYTILANLKKKFIDEGIPVVFTEFGARNKNNTEDRGNYVKQYVGTAKQYGITCFWWDDGGKTKAPEEVSNFAIFDRETNEWFFPSLARAIVSAADIGASTEDGLPAEIVWENDDGNFLDLLPIKHIVILLVSAIALDVAIRYYRNRKSKSEQESEEL